LPSCRIIAANVFETKRRNALRLLRPTGYGLAGQLIARDDAPKSIERGGRKAHAISV